MNHGSLFSGIGGFDLASEWMGWNNVFHCEWNEFGKKVLKYYWPNAISYHDITKTDFTIHRGSIDILTGGFPCQPYSAAGKRLGTADDRHLWPEMLRAIREIQPKWVVGENVLGITNWNGGLVFNEVQTDLETEGYEVQAYVLPAAAVNAPHRRDRVWFVAHAKGIRSTVGKLGKSQGKFKIQSRGNINGHDGVENAADTKSTGAGVNNRGVREGISGINDRETTKTKTITDSESTREQGQCEYRQRKIQSNRRNCCSIPTEWEKFPTQPPVCGGDDGLPRELDGITFPKWRAESIKAGGNAIVPQVALQIFKAIQACS